MKIVLECISGEVSTRIKIEEQLMGVDWECLDGEAMWGSPFKGKTLGLLTRIQN